jgi:D-lactate dehydrogenase
MRIAVCSATPYERSFLDAANAAKDHELVYVDARLGPETVPLVSGFPFVRVFVNDQLDGEVLAQLA